MSTSLRPRFLFVLAALLAAPVLSPAAEPSGQPQPPRRGPNPPGDAERRPQRFMQQPMTGGPIESVLTPEQRGQFMAEMQSHREKLRELNEKAMRLRREIDEAMFAEKLDESIIRKKTAELAEAETERSLIRARAFAKVRPSLSEEQLERLKNARPEPGRGPGPGPGGPRPGQPRPPRGPEGGPGDGEVLPPPAPPAK